MYIIKMPWDYNFVLIQYKIAILWSAEFFQLFWGPPNFFLRVSGPQA
jgi:hypothetical protein